MLNLLNLLGAFAEFERTLIRERQREGIRLAQTAGKYKGRTQKLTGEQLDSVRRLIETGVPKAKVARDLQIDRTTLYRALARSLADGPVGGVRRPTSFRAGAPRSNELGRQTGIRGNPVVAAKPGAGDLQAAVSVRCYLLGACRASSSRVSASYVCTDALSEGELRYEDLPGAGKHAFLTR
jgi:hypothetical protein